jgi:hypothetical protein
VVDQFAKANSNRKLGKTGSIQPMAEVNIDAASVADLMICSLTTIGFNDLFFAASYVYSTPFWALSLFGAQVQLYCLYTLFGRENQVQL